MDDVVGVLQGALQAIDSSGDPCKDSFFVYALKLEIQRVKAHLENSRAQQLASGAPPKICTCFPAPDTP